MKDKRLVARKSLLGRLFFDDYVFSVVAKISGVFIALVYSAFYNRYLGASLKGEAAIVSNYLSLISAFACVGMYQAYPFYKKKEGDVFYPFLNTMTSAYILLLVVSVGFALLCPGINPNLRLAVVLVPIHSYIRHINYVVTIEEPRRRSISYLLISTLDLMVVVTFFAFSEATYKHMVEILLIQAAINLAISYSNLKAKLSHFRFTLSLLPKYMCYGFMPMITLFLMTVNYRVDILMLEQFDGVTTAQIGIYSVGVMLAEKVWLLPDTVKDILLSRLCKGEGTEEVAKITRICLAVVLVLIVFVALLSGLFVEIVYGAEYAGADTVTLIMLLGVIGMIFYKMVYAYNVAQGKRGINLLLLAVAAVLNVVGNLFFIPWLGIHGAAWTSVISYNICGLGFLIYFRMVSGIPISRMILLQKQDLCTIGLFGSKGKRNM